MSTMVVVESDGIMKTSTTTPPEASYVLAGPPNSTNDHKGVVYHHKYWRTLTILADVVCVCLFGVDLIRFINIMYDPANGYVGHHVQYINDQVEDHPNEWTPLVVFVTVFFCVRIVLLMCGIYGAVNYNSCMIGTALVVHAFDAINCFYFQFYLSALVYTVFAIPHFVFLMEFKSCCGTNHHNDNNNNNNFEEETCCV